MPIHDPYDRKYLELVSDEQLRKMMETDANYIEDLLQEKPQASEESPAVSGVDLADGGGTAEIELSGDTVTGDTYTADTPKVVETPAKTYPRPVYQTGVNKKNKSESKARRKMAKQSRRINRGK
jgi:hypothetical protein